MKFVLLFHRHRPAANPVISDSTSDVLVSPKVIPLGGVFLCGPNPSLAALTVR